MQEDFLHYIWQYKMFETSGLKTADGESVIIKSTGLLNENSGPDFFNSQLSIGGQHWAGNVEIHIKSSDWYVHNHEIDKNYDNVILHVVWEYDTEIFRKNNTKIPTLVLKPYVNKKLLKSYKTLLQSVTWINCENQFSKVDDFVLYNWLERLYIERLEKKSTEIHHMLTISNNDWEAVLFKMLLKNFGLKVNGDAFLSIANSIDFTVVRKVKHDIIDMEALLFGQANLLNTEVEDGYFIGLKHRYGFLRQKFNLNTQGTIPVQFFRLRPPNFPTIRLSQFANLYTLEPNLFSKVINLSSKKQFYNLFKRGVTDFWMTHYTFTKTSKVAKKLLTKTFIDLLIINTIIPIKFSYAKSQGEAIEEDLLNLIKELKIEKNSVISKFLELKPVEKNALNSQGLLQLKQNYCDNNKCLQCAVGNSLILKN